MQQNIQDFLDDLLVFSLLISFDTKIDLNNPNLYLGFAFKLSMLEGLLFYLEGFLWYLWAWKSKVQGFGGVFAC